MGKKNQIAERGDEVICEVTGFRGIVTGETKCLQGMTRFDVQPGLDKKGKMGECWTIDATSLKVLVKGKIKALPPIKVNDVELGNEVEDILSGFRGVVIAESLAINGCTRVVVQPKIDKEGKLPKAEAFDVGRLKTIKVAKIPDGQRETGAPMERSEGYAQKV